MSARAAVLYAAIMMAFAWPPRTVRVVSAQQAQAVQLPGHVPAVVRSGDARLVGHHPPTDRIRLALGLRLRDRPALERFLGGLGDPKSPDFRQFLTQREANQRFGPTLDQQERVIGFLRGGGLNVNAPFANHLLVDATGTFGQVEALLHITLNDYTVTRSGKVVTFYSTDREPTVDPAVAAGAQGIVGLDSLSVPQRRQALRLDRASVRRSRALRSPRAVPHQAASSCSASGTGLGSSQWVAPYYPQDFANAYGLNGLIQAGYNGAGEHIAIVSDLPPPDDGSLCNFATQTGSKPRSLGSGLTVTHVDCTTATPCATTPGLEDSSEEVAQDVEDSGGLAPGATVDWYQAPFHSGAPIEDALNQAGTSQFAHQISSSWTAGCDLTSDPSGTAFLNVTNNTLMANSSTGHAYLFASGDGGAGCATGANNYGVESTIASPYGTGVGGTTLSASGSSFSETGWSGSGGGYSQTFPRPWWQIETGLAQNGQRGAPDVAADADQSTGSFICFLFPGDPPCSVQGQSWSYGSGTSLSAALMAGVFADINSYLSARTCRAGFINPTLYLVGNQINFSSANPRPFNDVTTGSNGPNNHWNAGVGWDPVTGWGSPNAWNLARAMEGGLNSLLAPYTQSLSATYSVAQGQQPCKLNTGTSYTYNVTVTNTGTSTWTGGSTSPSRVRLSVHFATLGGGYATNYDTWINEQRFDLPVASLAPGQSTSVPVTITAPSKTQNYVLEYEMVQYGAAAPWFPQYLDSSVFVGGSFAATYAPSGEPTTLPLGGSASYNVVLTNTGTETWSASDPNNPVHLGIHFAVIGGGYVLNPQWVTDQRFNLPADVPVGQSVTVPVNITAPSTPGCYVLETQLVQEWVVWFPQFFDSNVPVGTPSTCTYQAASSQQYRLTLSDGTNFVDMDPVNLSVTFTPSTSCTAIIYGNVDLFTNTSGYNQDVGISIAGGAYNGGIVAWKESGGAYAFSPDAALVQVAEPLTAGTTYTIKLQWKTNHAETNTTIWAGAGPLSGGQYSPTRLLASCVPSSAATSTASTSQYTLTASNGTTWYPVNSSSLALPYFTTPSQCSAVISGNADLWSTQQGLNADIGIFVNNSLVAWKESGAAGPFAPNAAFAQTVVTLYPNTNYNIALYWKANKATSGQIWDAAGPLPGSSPQSYSPTRLTVLCDSTSGIYPFASTAQYTLTNSDGVSWTDMGSALSYQYYNPSSSCLAIVSGNADLFTNTAGYNQDIGISINGSLAAWKESGGGYPYSPNAAFVQTVVWLQAGTSYSFKLQWKTNHGNPVPPYPAYTIYAGAGPLTGGSYSPSSLTIQC